MTPTHIINLLTPKPFFHPSSRSSPYYRSPANIATDREWRVWNGTLDKASSVMSSYTTANGRSSVNWDEPTMRSLRRSFDGIVVTDFDEVFNSVGFHMHARSVYESVVHFLNSEVDIFMVPSDPLGFIEMGARAVEEGLVKRETLERKVEKVWKFKEAMYGVEEKEKNAPENDPAKDIEMAKRAAAESVVLLKNDNATLPMPKETGIFLTGPLADSLASLCGGWTFHWQGPNRDDEGFKTLCSNGTNFCSTIEDGLMQKFDVVETEFSSDQVADAVSLNPDAIVVAIGEEPYAEKVRWIGNARASQKRQSPTLAPLAARSPQPGDIRSLHLPTSQSELIRNLRQALPSTKIIAVFVGGRPRILDDIVDNVDAMVASFLPGPPGGEAITDVLIGRTNPAARLPVQWPKFSDGGRRTYDAYVTDLCTNSQYEVGGDGDGIPSYEYVECDVQFRFGAGLSYTEFEETFEGAKEEGMDDYQPPGFLGATFKVSPRSSVQFKVKVKNIGSAPGEHVSMAFYEPMARSTTPRKEELFSFIRTEVINPGEEVELVHTLQGDEMKFFHSSSGTHFVFEESMTSFVKIGNAGSYCRQSTGDDDGSICLPLKVVVSAETDSVCGYSCDAWKTACSKGFSSYDSCVAACRRGGEEGAPWTWDYVDCVERVAAESATSGGGCAKIQSECRDVVDESGVIGEGSLEVRQVVGGGGVLFGLGGLVVGIGLGVLGMRQASMRGDQRMVLKDFDDDDEEDFSVEMKRMGMS